MLTKNEYSYIKDQFKIFRLTDRELDTYLLSLKIGSCSVQTISSHLNQNRVTIHSACAQLIKKGFLIESRKGNKRILSAESPQNLLKLITIKEQEIQSTKSNFGYVVGLLERNKSRLVPQPLVSFNKGTDGFKRMLEMTLSSTNEYLGIINVEIFSDHLSPAYLENFFSRRAKYGINSKLIWNKLDPFANKIIKKSTEYKIQVRLLNPSTHLESDWTSGFTSWNNYISLMSFNENQISCTIIQNDDIANFHRNTLFNALWDQALEITAKT